MRCAIPMRPLPPGTPGICPRSRLAFCVSALLICLAALVNGQTEHNSGALKGVVRDPGGHPAANATVYLQSKRDAPALIVRTDSQGAYSFSSLPDGSYSLRAELAGTGTGQFGPFILGAQEQKTVDLTLGSAASSTTMPNFYDEPQFTVAGVTQTGNAGGHGSDTVQRTSDALAKATKSLGKGSQDHSSQSGSIADLERAREELRKRLDREDTSELHHSLADVEELLSNPLAAVREYQRAAEMEPTESYLFDWGAELLAHRALEPAAEVFSKGHRLFPRSSRMLVGLGVVLYTRGSYADAVQRLFEASDLNPSDPNPYLFLGKMQGVETGELQGFIEKFARFVSLQPDSALANYYYAISLWKQSKTSGGEDKLTQVHDLLDKSVRLDPTLSAAYLQMGVIASERGDLQRAIANYRKAVDTDSSAIEAHYRLAQAYRRTGDKERTQRELELYNELSKKSADQAERERREIQQFVIKLRDNAPSTQSR